jgi:hypothetical protein
MVKTKFLAKFSEAAGSKMVDSKEDHIASCLL